jgi:hypothetical protein
MIVNPHPIHGNPGIRLYISNPGPLQFSSSSSRHSSKDAYMLIYTRRDVNSPSDSDPSSIPAMVRDDISAMNLAHENFCTRYEEVYVFFESSSIITQ